LFADLILSLSRSLSLKVVSTDRSRGEKTFKKGARRGRERAQMAYIKGREREREREGGGGGQRPMGKLNNVFFGGFCGRGDQWELIIFLNVFFGGEGEGGVKESWSLKKNELSALIAQNRYLGAVPTQLCSTSCWFPTK